MDILSDVLRVVRLSGAVFFTAKFSAPWALESPSPDLLASIVMPKAECVVLFHILTEGKCVVECGPHPPMRMEAGDVVIFPHGDPHKMYSHREAPSTPVGAVFSQGLADALPQVAFGGGGEDSVFICGYLNCDQRFNPLVSALPKMLLVRNRDGGTAVEAAGDNGAGRSRVPRSSGSWLSTTLKFTVNEAKAARPGNAAMLGRLTELMFVEILREYMQQLPADRGGWLAGLNDPHVGKAVGFIHSNPARDWTVTELAHQVGTSRSVLAQRFTELVGESPMRYLAGWRVQLAKQMLREGASIAEVAGRVGYESEAAFNRAFKRAAGSPPATWRRLATTALLSLSALLMSAGAWLPLDALAG